MSDLDTSLDQLRDDLRSGLAKPGLDRIADRARQRSVRRRMQIGAIVAVVLVSLAVPLLRSLPDPAPPATPPTPTEHSTPYHLSFADRTHAFALGRICDKPSEPCSNRLLASSDGGRTWSRRSVPSTTTDGGLAVLSRSWLIFYTTDPDDYGSLKTYTSKDSGRTWHPSRPIFDIVTNTATIQPGAVLQPVCLSGEGPDCAAGLGASTPDGKLAPLPAQPPLTELWPGRYATAGGTYWAVGKDQANRWAVAVTRDGSAWTTTPLDVPGEVKPSDGWSVVEGGGSLYATAVGSLAGASDRLLTVYRSEDRGKTWTQTRRAAETGEEMSMYGSPVATSDGRLVVSSLPDGTVESRDGGATFTKSTRQLISTPEWTPAGYLVVRGIVSYEISWNGLDWRRFDIP